MLEGDRLAADDRAAEAILAYRQAVEHDSRNVSALRKLARAYAGQERRRMAQRYLRQAFALQPGNTEISNEIAALNVPAPKDAPLKLSWQTLVGEDVPTGFTVSEGVLYVALEGGQVQALDAATGAVIWQIKLDTRLTSPPAVTNQLVFVGGQDGTLRALEAVDGSERWRVATKAPLYAAVTVAGGIVYCASGDGALYALSSSDGALRWKITTGGPLHGQPTVADDVVYVGSGDAKL